MTNINCIAFHAGQRRCLHQAAPRALFGARCIVADPSSDPRVPHGCRLQVEHARPAPGGFPPPPKPRLPQVRS